MNSPFADRERWLNKIRADWFRVMRPLGAWVPWELRDCVQLEERAEEEPFWGKGLMHQAPQLQEPHLRDCMVLPNRTILLEHLPHDATVAEVGTLHGDFAREILRIAHPKQLHLIDHEIRSRARTMAQEDSIPGRVHLHQSDSVQALESFPDAFFDWIYTDAQHTYEGVKRDIVVAQRKVKADGVLVFNDYIFWSYVEMQPYGVVPAVNEFCIENNWKLIYLTLPDHMYCDVAIQKMNC
jgi:Methyltransferase domain